MEKLVALLSMPSASEDAEAIERSSSSSSSSSMCRGAASMGAREENESNFENGKIKLW